MDSRHATFHWKCCHLIQWWWPSRMVVRVLVLWYPWWGTLECCTRIKSTFFFSSIMMFLTMFKFYMASWCRNMLARSNCVTVEYVWVVLILDTLSVIFSWWNEYLQWEFLLSISSKFSGDFKSYFFTSLPWISLATRLTGCNNKLSFSNVWEICLQSDKFWNTCVDMCTCTQRHWPLRDNAAEINVISFTTNHKLFSYSNSFIA